MYSIVRQLITEFVKMSYLKSDALPLVDGRATINTYKSYFVVGGPWKNFAKNTGFEFENVLETLDWFIVKLDS